MPHTTAVGGGSGGDARCADAFPAPGTDTAPRADAASAAEDIDGTLAWTGEAFDYVAPTGYGKYPTVTAADGIQVLVDGDPVAATTVVLPEQTLSVRSESRPPHVEIEVGVDEGRLQATITVHLRPGIAWRAKPQGPATDLVLEADAVELPAPPPSVDDVLERLRARGVVCGVDHEAVARAIGPEAGRPVVAARAVPPQAPVDDEIEWVFALRARGECAVCVPGEVLAVHHEGRAGRPGQDVYGGMIEPPPPKRCALEAHAGTLLLPGGKVIATEKGRPKVVDGTIEVVRCHVVQGDLGAPAAPLSFDGDVRVEGNVGEGAKIDAGGNVYVGGLVSGATIEAGGSIEVAGSVTQSQLFAGQRSTALTVVAPVLDELVLALEGAAAQAEAPAGKSASEAISTALAGGEGQDIRRSQRHLAELLTDLPESPFVDQLRKLLDQVRRLRRTYAERNDTPLALVSALIREFKELLKQAQGGGDGGRISVASVQNSRLQAGGDIEIVDKGCTHSTLLAGGRISVSGSLPVLRVGEAVARTGVSVGELGGPQAATTSVIVSREGEITARIAHPNTILRIGGRMQTLEHARRDLHARLDDAGELTL